eukprot:gene9017-1116_t
MFVKIIVALIVILLAVLARVYITDVLIFDYRFHYFYFLFFEAPLKLLPSYDFIVVGGGTAGALLASRLSENPKHNVLLLEAGPMDHSLVLKPSLLVPGACIHGAGVNSIVDWHYKTKDNDLSMKSLHRLYPRGKVLGGSATINWLQYVRGHQKDYNNWKNQGNDGWSYEEVLKYFKKSEHFQNETMNEKYHSKEGLIGVRYPAHIGETVHRFVKAGEELGYPKNYDYNGERQEGFSISQQTISEEGYRSTSTQYIKQFMNTRPNLHVSTMSHVTKILLTKENVAHGVEIKRGDEIISIKAEKEVIISAGAVASPQLLMLSGIGPKEHLKEMEIETKVDSPNVGQNLQDHPILSMEYNSTYYGLRQDDLESTHYILKYLMFKNNYLGGSPVLGTAFLNSSINEFPFPDLQIHFLPSATPCRSFKSLFGWKDGHCQVESADALGFIIVLLHEKSVGSVKLNSKNPMDHPIIDLNFFSHPEDKKKMLEGIRIVQKLASSKQFDEFRVEIKKNPMNPEKFDSDEYWKWNIENYGGHLFHAAGTCKMGKSINNSVVDSRLRVHGVKNLRVVDASIMPTITSGNTMAPVYMIAEKAADMLKEDN